MEPSPSDSLPAVHPMVGRTLGNYLVERLIGQGGMGEVFAGQHRYLGDRVAIKVLHRWYAENESVTARFFQEARAARSIQHSNIVRVLDFGRQEPEGDLYLVMELLEGRSLGPTLAAGGNLVEKTVARIGAQIADGLAAAHRLGIVHRDLKPDNIFLCSPDERVKILDFGIAKLHMEAGPTASGALIGTPHYMAPEQAKDTHRIGPRTDIYALGVLLYRMSTGQTPFNEQGVAELIAQHLFAPVPRPSTMAAMSPALEALILHCLEKDPAARPASMEEVRDRLLPLAGVATPIAIAAETVVGPVAPGVVTVLLPGGLAKPGGPSTLSASVGEVVTRLPVIVSRRSRLIAMAGGVAAALVVALFVAAPKRQASIPSVTATARQASPPRPSLPTPSMLVTSLPRPELPARPAPQTLTPAAVPRPAVLKTVPAGARVLVGGVLKGSTPVTLSLVFPQEVELNLDGYRTTREVVMGPGVTTVSLVRQRTSHPTVSRLPAPRSSSSSSRPSVKPAMPGRPMAPAAPPPEGLD